MKRQAHQPLIDNSLDYAFWGLGAALIGAVFLFTSQSYRFSYDYRVDEMPIFSLVTGLFIAGLLYVLLFLVIKQLAPRAAKFSSYFLCGVFAVGLVMRVILLFSEPVLEDDWQRYLWDGAVVANGANPYKYSPKDVIDGKAPEVFKSLAEQAPITLERVNHPHLRTIYPVGSEALFALAYKISPFSLTSWRLVILAAELISFCLLVAMLAYFMRPQIWIALYWWNPLVAKELINSAHMEGVLVPFVLAGLYFFMRHKLQLANLALCLAASIKLWPALLLPLIWRKMFDQKAAVILAVIVSLLFGAITIAPFIISGFDRQSGLVAYSLNWKTNSALFPFFETVVAWVVGIFGFGESVAALSARGFITMFLIGLVLRLSFMRNEVQLQNLWPFYLVTMIFFLVSPAQFPWYFVWLAPFLVFYPSLSFSVLVAMMAFYYGGFYLHVAGLYQDYRLWLALLIWMPVLGLLWFEKVRGSGAFHARR